MASSTFPILMDDPNLSPAAPESGTTPETPAPNAAPSPGLDAIPQHEPLAPGVPRLGSPRGAASRALDPTRKHPSFVFLGVVAIVTLASDISSKMWAEKRLETYPPFTQIWDNHLTFTLAKNRGGAWGILQTANENIRRPFFLLVSVAAIAFIMTLYRRLNPNQRALKWGLPLVLGGALGNVFDRIRYGHVIDFIDYRADWMRVMNERLLHNSNDHWPTFNIADVAICVGVGLMAIDMFTSKRGARPVLRAPLVPPSQSGEPAADWYGGPPAPLPSSEVLAADVPPPVADPPAPAPPADVPPAEPPPTQ